MGNEHDNESRKERYKQHDKHLETQSKKSPFNVLAPRFTLERDVVLPSISKMHIDEALIKINHHKTIYIDWGFEEVDPVGKGIVLNFFGRPGTGKTLTAEALAGTLKKPFISLGIAEIESKFMGETSKNIQTVFALAKEYDAVIFLTKPILYSASAYHLSHKALITR